MVDIPGDKFLQQIGGLLVSQLLEQWPEFSCGVDFLDADGGSLLTRLEHPRARNVVEIILDVAVVHDRNEVRDAHLAIESSHAHSEFVAEIAHGGKAHAGNAQMLAERSRGLHVEFVERHDAIDFLVAGQMGDGLHDIVERNLLGKVEGIVEALAGPVGIPQFLSRQQDHAAAASLALAHEFLPFFVGGDAEKCQRAGVRHESGSDQG